MKKITNKETKIFLNEKGVEKALKYSDLISYVINYSPEGKDISEIRFIFKILDKIEKPTKEIELEDAEFDFLIKKLDITRWQIAHNDILDFNDYLKILQAKNQ